MERGEGERRKREKEDKRERERGRRVRGIREGVKTGERAGHKKTACCPGTIIHRGERRCEEGEEKGEERGEKF